MTTSLLGLVHGTAAQEVAATVEVLDKVVARRGIFTRIVPVVGLAPQSGLPWQSLPEHLADADEALVLCVPARPTRDTALADAIGAALDACSRQPQRVLWRLPPRSLEPSVGRGLPPTIAALLDPPERSALVLFPSRLGRDPDFPARCEFLGTSLARSLLGGENWTIGNSPPAAIAIPTGGSKVAALDPEDPRDPLSRLVHRPVPAERREIVALLRRVTAADLAGPKGSDVSATALLAGLRLRHDDFDGAHAACQEIEGTGPDHDGDYWHAILHRREPDAGNAGYWFRHVGRHPIFPGLARAAEESLASAEPQIAAHLRNALALPGKWDPNRFVAACDAARTDEDSPRARALRRIQRIEIDLLLAQCTRNAGCA